MTRAYRACGALLGSLLISACNLGTGDGGDRSAVFVRGDVANRNGVPLKGLSVRALTFVRDCGGTYHGADAGIPQPTTDEAGRYLLLVQSRLQPQRACVMLTAEGAGMRADTVLQQVEFRELRTSALDTVTANLRLPQ